MRFGSSRQTKHTEELKKKVFLFQKVTLDHNERFRQFSKHGAECK